MLTPEALEEFQLSRRALLTPEASLDEARPAVLAVAVRGSGQELEPRMGAGLSCQWPRREPMRLPCLPPLQDAAERGMAAWPSGAAEVGSPLPSSPARTSGAASLSNGGRPGPVTAAPASPVAASEVAMAALPPGATQDGHGGATEGAGAVAAAPAPPPSAFAVQGSGFSE